MSKVNRVAILTNIIPGYRLPVFKRLAEASEWRLKIFLSLPLDRSDPLAVSTLPMKYSRTLNVSRRSIHAAVDVDQVEPLPIPVFLPWDILTFRPHIIVSAEFGVRSLFALACARLLGIPLVLWSEETPACAAGKSPLQQRLRAFLIPRASAHLAWGNAAVEYIRQWGIPPQRIHYCAQAVDNEFWGRESGRHLVSAKSELGFQGRVFLAVGRLLSLKGFDLLIRAWAELPAVIQEANTLVVVGGGPEETNLRVLAVSLNIEHLHFAGPQSRENLAKYYAAADLLVFPSLVDVWGLVVNEAMACGLPVLASQYAGASQELVGDSGYGEVFDPRDITEFAKLLEKWCLNPPVFARSKIQNFISQYSFDVTAATFLRVLDSLKNTTP